MLSFAFLQNGNSEVEAPAAQVTSPIESQSSSTWSLFADQEENKELLSLRKKALTELQDGASYFAACGDINAGFFGNCRFTFSSQVQKAYEPQVEAQGSSFRITLVAQGEQAKDGCVRFIASSDGSYVAYDRNGARNAQCFVGTALREQNSVYRRMAEHIDDKKSVPVLANSH